MIFAESQSSRQSYTSAESLPSAFSFSLRGPSYSRSGGPPSHIFTLQSHPPASSVSLGLNPSVGSHNPYSTPLPHFPPPPLPPPPNHAPSPPPYNLLPGAAGRVGGDSQDSSSPKLLPRDGPYGVRSSLRYSTFQQSGMSSPGQAAAAAGYPPQPPVGAASAPRFSLFQPIGSALVQAEAALWGEQRPSPRDPPGQHPDKKSRGERDLTLTNSSEYMSMSIPLTFCHTSTLPHALYFGF